MARQATTTAVNTESLTDVTLWVRIDIPRFIRVTECELASAVLTAVNSTEDDLRLGPKEILGVQFMSASQPSWIVNLASKQAKAMVLATDNVILKGKSFKISDFSSPRPTKHQKSKDIRLSIHGIPQNILDAEVESWVSTFASIASPIFRHKSKDRGSDNQFEHLLTGHRYCYVSKILEDKPRYSPMSIADPLVSKKLIDIEVVLYYTGQPEMNCRYCHSPEHIISSCPSKPRVKCYLCGTVGHVQQRCPDRERGPMCFKCHNYGHKSYECVDGPKSQTTKPTQKPDTSNKNSDITATTPTTQRAAQATALAQELIDHCLYNNSKSPEILNKVKALLNFDDSDDTVPEPIHKSPVQSKLPKKGGKNKSKTNKAILHPPPNQATSIAAKTKQSSLKDFGTSTTRASSKRKIVSPTISTNPDKRGRRDGASLEEEKRHSSVSETVHNPLNNKKSPVH
jgi:hypothetical protein